MSRNDPLGMTPGCTCDTVRRFSAAIAGTEDELCPVHEQAAIEARATDRQLEEAVVDLDRRRQIHEELHAPRRPTPQPPPVSTRAMLAAAIAATPMPPAVPLGSDALMQDAARTLGATIDHQPPDAA